MYQNIAAAFNGISGYSFLVFNLLCAPCFAAIGAIKREMNSQKWTWFAIGYQCGFAYPVSYTHLDVYKRQQRHSDEGADRDGDRHPDLCLHALQ